MIKVIWSKPLWFLTSGGLNKRTHGHEQSTTAFHDLSRYHSREKTLSCLEIGTFPNVPVTNAPMQ